MSPAKENCTSLASLAPSCVDHRLHGYRVSWKHYPLQPQPSTLARSSFSHPPKCLHLDSWTVNPASRPLRSYVVVSFRQAFASPHSSLLVADIKHQSGTYRAWKFYRLTLLVFMFPLVKMRDVRSASSLVVRKNP